MNDIIDVYDHHQKYDWPGCWSAFCPNLVLTLTHREEMEQAHSGSLLRFKIMIMTIVVMAMSHIK